MHPLNETPHQHRTSRRCPACCVHFRDVQAFARHRTGRYKERRCIGIPQLPDASLELDARGVWRLATRRSSKTRIARREDRQMICESVRD
jgi:hypothetical protein